MEDNTPVRLSAALDKQQSSSRKVSRRLAQAIEAEQHRALRHSARLEGAAYVTHVAQTHIAMLAKEEEQLLRYAPLADERLKMLGDAFAMVAANEVLRMGWER